MKYEFELTDFEVELKLSHSGLLSGLRDVFASRLGRTFVF